MKTLEQTLPISAVENRVKLLMAIFNKAPFQSEKRKKVIELMRDVENRYIDDRIHSKTVFTHATCQSVSGNGKYSLD